MSPKPGPDQSPNPLLPGPPTQSRHRPIMPAFQADAYLATQSSNGGFQGHGESSCQSVPCKRLTATKSIWILASQAVSSGGRNATRQSSCCTRPTSTSSKLSGTLRALKHLIGFKFPCFEAIPSGNSGFSSLTMGSDGPFSDERQ